MWRNGERTAGAGLIIHTYTWIEGERNSPFHHHLLWPVVDPMLSPLPPPPVNNDIKDFASLSFPWNLPPPITPTSSSLLLGLPLDAAVETNWQWWRVTRTIVDYTSQDKHVSTYDNQHQCAATQRPWAVQSGHKGSTSCYQISHPHQGTICLVCSVRTVWETLLLQLLSYFAHRIWQYRIYYIARK